jgi:two-component system sensor histidine kinase UhpB
MGLKLRLNLMITLLMTVVLVIAIQELLVNAKKDIRAEVASTAKLAEKLLDVQILYIATNSGSNFWGESPFHLRELANLRHLHIEFFDKDGRRLDTNQLSNQLPEEPPPQWFVSLLQTRDANKMQIRRPIVIGGKPMGELVITPDASYEISEVWNDTSSLLILWTGFFVLVNIMVYWAVAVALGPIKRISQALSDIGNGNLDSRLSSLNSSEFLNIQTQFNLMADSLQKARKDNIRLTKKIINTQEEERKVIARDLHDDLSQSVTTIQVLASSVNASKKISSAHLAAKSILETTQSIRKVIRNIMQNLRPGCLDELGLRIALKDFLQGWEKQNPSIQLQAKLQYSDINPSETVSIAIFRTLQEALTNITRYANASEVRVTLQLSDDYVSLEIEDNGLGFDPNGVIYGFGLLGIRERIEGLSGKFNLETQLGMGTKIQVVLPVEESGIDES